MVSTFQGCWINTGLLQFKDIDARGLAARTPISWELTARDDS